jgi:hypothetical protein
MRESDVADKSVVEAKYFDHLGVLVLVTDYVSHLRKLKKIQKFKLFSLTM